MKLPKIKRVGAFIFGLAALFIAVVIGIAVFIESARKDEKLAQARLQAQHFVTGAEVAINRSLLGIDIMLASVDSLLELSAVQSPHLSTESANRLIQNTVRQNLLVSRLALLDSHGNVLASSEAADVASHMALPSMFLENVLNPVVNSLIVSSPVVSFQSSEQVLYMGRALNAAGNVRLVVVAEVQVPQLSRVLAQGADISGLQATLERGNGELLVASNNNTQIADTRLYPPLDSLHSLEQTQNLPARPNREPAIVAVRKSLYRDLYITASIPVASALHDWEQETRFVRAVTVLMVVLISGSAALARWYLRRLERIQFTMLQGKTVLDQALESMHSGFILLDAAQRIVTWNRRFIELHPWLKDNMTPLMPFRKVVEITADHVLPQAQQSQRDQWVIHRLELLTNFQEERQVTAMDGTILEITERPTSDGGVVIVYQDVTRLRHAIADVEQLAFYDPLTGLPNRRLLNDRLQQGIHASVRSGRHGALLFLDLDHFKTLNDTSGHEVGDQLLQQVATRLKSCVREEDTVARLGGDEFVVMMQNLSSVAEDAVVKTRIVAQTILDRLNKPYRLQRGEHICTCSIGATLFGTQMQDASELLRQSDIAMYQVKSAGRNGVCFFDQQMQTAVTERADMERDLRIAMREQQFVVYYQIQVDAQDRAIGAEALLRWVHPELGLVPPAQFIGLAEETGLIVEIGNWVLRTACLQCRTWQGQPGAANLHIAVNVSARQFRSSTFMADVSAILEETGVAPHHIKLELTESVVLHNVDEAIEKMQQLKRLGVGFAMDDFGTGYSSLSYLTRLPLDQLKIDRSFVQNIGIHSSDAAVIDTIIGLAGNLGLEVIAEGVETEDQLNFLASHGCKQFQGYLFGHPLPLEQFEAQLQDKTYLT